MQITRRKGHVWCIFVAQFFAHFCCV